MTPETPSEYVGRRVARPVATPEPPAPVAADEALAPAYVGRRVKVLDRPVSLALPAETLPPLTPSAVALAEPLAEPLLPATDAPDTPATTGAPAFDTATISRVLADLEPADQSTSFATEDTEVLPLPLAKEPGRRRAVRDRRPRVVPRVLVDRRPPISAMLGLATLAVSACGAIATYQGMGGDDGRIGPIGALGAMGGTSGQTSLSALSREASISRDSARDAADDAAGGSLTPEIEDEVVERNAGLRDLASRAEKFAAQEAENAWVLPVASYHLTARFGDYGLWSSYHTGLDFATDTGTPIMAVAAGTVTSTGYDGAYGNKTVVTLEDGTEIWYCHQTSILVSPGDVVTPGETIGTVGSTGNVTGPHLHLEVRPGGGDPVDPYGELVVHGVTP